MKKYFKILLVSLCLCPILIFSACKSPASYLITILPSDFNLGTTKGVDNKIEQAEGTSVTLSATELFPETNPFICWIKDYKKVVSTSKNYTLTYSAKTAGNYTALFDEAKTNIMFATLKSINIEAEGYSTVSYDIKYALISSGSNDYTDFENGTFTIGDLQTFDNINVLYLGKAGVNNEYKFNVALTLSNSANEQISFDFQLNTLLNRNLFDSSGICSFSAQQITKDDVTISVQFDFEKLSYSLIHK